MNDLDEMVIPAALLPAVSAAADAIAGTSAAVLTDTTEASLQQRQAAALAMLRAAVDARCLVARPQFDDLDAQLRMVSGHNDRLVRQMEEVGAQRQRIEQLCHTLAEALESGLGVSEALGEYRRASW